MIPQQRYLLNVLQSGQELLVNNKNKEPTFGSRSPQNMKEFNERWFDEARHCRDRVSDSTQTTQTAAAAAAETQGAVKRK